MCSHFQPHPLQVIHSGTGEHHMLQTTKTESAGTQGDLAEWMGLHRQFFMQCLMKWKMAGLLPSWLRISRAEIGTLWCRHQVSWTWHSQFPSLLLLADDIEWSWTSSLQPQRVHHYLPKTTDTRSHFNYPWANIRENHMHDTEITSNQ